jgi:transcriptional regulator with XRE-family HTH domain
MNGLTSTTSSTLGTVIKARRRELGWSQEELAARVAAHGDAAFRQTDVSRLERGKVSLPRRQRLGHIAAALGLSLGELLMRLGWIDDGTAPAAHAFRIPPTPSEPFAASTPRPAVPRALGTEVARVVSSSPLRELIAQSEEIRRESLGVLQRCEATRTRSDEVSWMRGRRDPRSRITSG